MKKRKHLAIVYSEILLRFFLEKARFTASTCSDLIKIIFNFTDGTGPQALCCLRPSQFELDVFYPAVIKQLSADALFCLRLLNKDSTLLGDDFRLLAIDAEDQKTTATYASLLRIVMAKFRLTKYQHLLNTPSINERFLVKYALEDHCKAFSLQVG